MMHRLVLAFCALLCSAVSLSSAMATDNDKPLEWVLGYPAGGGSDAVARIVAEEMTKTLKRPVVINNKPGAATNIAAEYVVRSKDFGNIIFSADSATLAANPALFKKLSYNAKNDLASVGLLARFPLILIVSNKVSANNLKEFLVWAKTNPTALNFASAGVGSAHHLTMEMFADQAGLKLSHIPYKGAAPALTDMVGGQVPMMFIDSASGGQFITSGKVKAIGLASPTRLATMPDLPTLAEQGMKGFEAYAWQGVAAPVGTSPESIQTLNAALKAALNATNVKARLQVMGVEGLPSTPEQMTRYADAERERWGRLIRDKHISME